MRFVAQKGTNRICFSTHTTEKHSPPLGNPFLRSKYHFRSLGNTLLSPKRHFQSFESPIQGKKMHSKVFFSISQLGKKKSNATSEKSSIAAYFQKPNKWFY